MFLTCIQISQEAGKVVWYSHLFQNLPVCCDLYKIFNIVNETEVDLFLELACFIYFPVNGSILMYGSSAFSKPGLYIWKSSIQVLLKPSLKVFEHNLTSMGSECNCLVVWMFFSTSFLWSWDGKLASSFYSNYTPI